MLSKNDLIFLGACILLSGQDVNYQYTLHNTAIGTAKKMFAAVFEEESNSETMIVE